MSKLTLYIPDEHTSTGYREATLDEIMTGARHALSLRVRRGTKFTSPKVTADYQAHSPAGFSNCTRPIARVVIDTVAQRFLKLG